MSNYRLYFMNARSGHIIRFAEYEAPDNDAAVALAREHEGAQALELWGHGGKIARVEPSDPASAFLARWQAAREARRQSSDSGRLRS